MLIMPVCLLFIILSFINNPVMLVLSFILLFILVLAGGILFDFRWPIIYWFKEHIPWLNRKNQSGISVKSYQTERDNRYFELMPVLIDYMNSEKPYLNPRLRQADVAAALGITVHELSQLLNNRMHLSFPDFINGFRVQAFKERIKEDDWHKYTLIAVAMQCGFSSKTSFIRTFKKITGMTPSDYLRQLQEANNRSDASNMEDNDTL
jgi:AraC-like DNA-binding protein